MDEKPYLTEIDSLRIIYQQIVQGFSYSREVGYYIKHLNELDNIEILNKRNELLLKFKKEGLPTYHEKLQTLIEQERWSKAKEEEIEFLKQLIVDNEKHMKSVIPQQKPPLEKIIKDSQQKITELETERAELVGSTANEFAERDSYTFLIHYTFFKDRKLEQRVFENFEDLDDLEYVDIAKYGIAIDKVLGQFKEENVKAIATLPSFINVFSYAKENVSTFYGKPLSELSSFQILLASLGSRNLNILSQTEAEPPSMIGSEFKMSELVDWYDLQYSVILGRRNNGGQGGITRSVKEVKTNR